MSDFSTELEILQDENFAIKAPKGFKGEDWKSKSGRPGRVLYSRFSPDYMTSDCYITVSTIARDPIIDEIRKRIEKHLGKDGFDFKFQDVGDRHFVLYFHEEEMDYKTYHAFILLSEKKAVMMDVVFNAGFDNSREVAEAIITSIRTNFKSEVSEEELAADAARLEAEDRAEAAKEAAKKAQIAAQGNVSASTPKAPQHTVAEMKEEPQGEASYDTEPVEEEPAELVQEAAKDAGQEEALKQPENTEVTFDSSDEGKHKQIIYDAIKQQNRMTLSELQAVPELLSLDLGRMEITKLLNVMIRDKILVRLEEADNIYFAIPGMEKAAASSMDESDSAHDSTGSDLDPMDQYKIDMEKYKADLAEWKKSKDFFGRTDKPKPVEPVKPKKKK